MMIYEQVQYSRKDIIKVINLYTSKSNQFSMNLHYHRSIEIIYSLSNEINVFVEGKNHTVKENEIFVINSKEIHCLSSKQHNQDCKKVFGGGVHFFNFL